jgi:hypothetical protein
VFNVQEANQTQPADWNPSPQVLAQLRAAVNREPYPPRQRTGVGAVARFGRRDH